MIVEQISRLWGSRLSQREWGLAVLVAVASIVAGHAADVDDAGPPVFRYAFSDDTLSAVDMRDARVSLEMWLDRASETMAIGLRPEVTIYQQPGKLQDSTAVAVFDAVSLPALEYVRMRGRARLSPSMMGSSGDVATRTYVLLCRGDLGAESVADLAGRDVIVLSGGLGQMPGLWLDVLALRARRQSSAELFRVVKNAATASRAALPVFFGKADACVVTERAFDVMAELNPQLAQALVALAESPPFAWGLTCFSADYDSGRRHSLEHAALTMHTDPEGRQALMLFGLDRMVRFDPAFLRSVEELVAEHDSLTTRDAHSATPPH